MPSKYCRKCKRIISCNYVPNFCCYGCGSLENEPLLPYFETCKEQQEYIEKLEAEPLPMPPPTPAAQPIKTNQTGQVQLFNPGDFRKTNCKGMY